MDTVAPPPPPESGGAPEDPARTEEQAAAARSARLTRLRIAGFKSFAEATVVEVLPGLTGIVGPNGCGKSNVVEALRWAMGETNARSMRGGEMDDVIFAGTATRPGRNLAEVTLVLEEAAGLAPPPERRRRGARDHPPHRARRGLLLQGERAGAARARRADDVRRYRLRRPLSAMVSQGRVSSLIQAKPEDRRAVLEEAAGIAGLRARKHEAELKLRQAENNLARAEDLLTQMEEGRQSLQRQARQAARYRNLSGLVRGAEVEWLAILRARAQAALAAAKDAFALAPAATGDAEFEAEGAAKRLFEAERDLPAPKEAEAVARTALERRRVEAETLGAEESRAREALTAAETRHAALKRDLDHAMRMAADAEAAERGWRRRRRRWPRRGRPARPRGEAEAAEVAAAEGRAARRDRRRCRDRSGGRGRGAGRDARQCRDGGREPRPAPRRAGQRARRREGRGRGRAGAAGALEEAAAPAAAARTPR
jgi:chromosome segregation protein